MINGIESDKHPVDLQKTLPFSIPIPSNCYFYPEEESFESITVQDSSLQLSKSSVSQDQNAWKSKLLSPTSPREYEQSKVNSNKTLSDLSFNQSINDNEIPIETWRMSEAITSAKGSFCDNLKSNEGKFSIHLSSFAVPSKIYCKNCDKEVFTVVLTQVCQPRFWRSFEHIFSSFICCEDKSRYGEKELVHCCNQCRKVLARISAGV